MSRQTHISAPPDELYWRHEVCPDRGAKVLLRTIGGTAWIGRWGQGEVGDYFVAWCPLPRDGKPTPPQPRIEDAPLLARIRFALSLIFNPRKTR